MAVMRRGLLMLVVLVAVTVSTAPSIQAHTNKKPVVTPASWIECQYTTETDNIFNSHGSTNPYVDSVHADPSKNNQWDVYYDIQRDSTNGVACNMRVVVRIFPPSGGSFSGSLAVFALDQSTSNQVPGSWGELDNGYTAYPGHLVFRGPWFGVGPGNYQIGSYYRESSGLWVWEAQTGVSL